MQTKIKLSLRGGVGREISLETRCCDVRGVCSYFYLRSIVILHRARDADETIKMFR